MPASSALVVFVVVLLLFLGVVGFGSFSAVAFLRLNFGFPPRAATMSASAAGISYSGASLQSGAASARGHGAPCCCPARSSAVRNASLGSGRKLCSPRFRAQKVSPSRIKCGARVRSTLTTDLYQHDEHDIAQSRKEEHESGIDLKQWMHEQGLPECKVALAEHRPWEGDMGRPIHYVVASQDLQVSEILTGWHALICASQSVRNNAKESGFRATSSVFSSRMLKLHGRFFLVFGPPQRNSCLVSPFDSWCA